MLSTLIAQFTEAEQLKQAFVKTIASEAKKIEQKFGHTTKLLKQANNGKNVRSDENSQESKSIKQSIFYK